VTINAEGQNRQGEALQFSQMLARVIGPDLAANDLPLVQVGPGQYRGTFSVGDAGSYLVNLRYTRADGQGGAGLVQAVVTVPYAPEYADLTDNAALLSEVAAETHGRVLSSDPAKADLFSRAGLTFPKEPLPIVAPLIILWIVLFLLDVAVRRVAIEPRKVAARIGAWARRLIRRPTGQTGEHLAALRERRTRVHAQLTRQEQAAAAQRFEEAPGRQVALPDEKFPAAGPASEKKPATTPSAPKVEKEEADGLSRLLQAKRRKAQDKNKET